MSEPGKVVIMASNYALTPSKGDPGRSSNRYGEPRMCGVGPVRIRSVTATQAGDADALAIAVTGARDLPRLSN